MRRGRELAVWFGLAAALAPLAGAWAQPTDATAQRLQDDVVRITATIGQGSPQTGFGIIVGQQGADLVVVTADHVVRGDDPGAEDKTPSITFFRSQGSQVQGRLQTVRLPRDAGDLAVVLVARPGFAAPVAPAIDPKPVVRGEKVWLVGRAGNWSIPASPGTVAQTNSFSGLIQVEELAARRGSSGGPLISTDGIVGMILDDNDLYTEARPIEPIARKVRDDWRYAWDLTPNATASAFVAPPISGNQPPAGGSTDTVPPQPNRPGAYRQPLPLEQANPSFPCDKATAAVEFLVCHDVALADLDVELANVYQTVFGRLSASDQQSLKRDESGWIKQRNDCAGAVDIRGCVVQAYRSRIAYLQSY